MKGLLQLYNSNGNLNFVVFCFLKTQPHNHQIVKKNQETLKWGFLKLVARYSMLLLCKRNLHSLLNSKP